MTDPDFIQANYDNLVSKVKGYFEAVERYKISGRANDFYDKCNKEKELKKLINPERVKQAELNWLAQ